MSQTNILENNFINAYDCSYNTFDIKDTSKNILIQVDYSVDKYNNEYIPDYKNSYTQIKNDLPEINYINFSTNNITFTKYKIPALKSAVKTNNLPVSGTKKVLIDRLLVHFNRIKYTIIIQTHFRGWIVRQSFKLRGPAIKNRTICVNDTDFITMEPIIEIEHEYFFSYTDKNKFTYGFNIVSLVQMFNKQNQKCNPYNREKFDTPIINNIVTLYNLNRIIYPGFSNVNRAHITGQRQVHHIARANTRRRNVNIPVVLPNSNYTLESQTRFIRILELRQLSVDQRIQNLFMEIDQLGNYTQSEWFHNLDMRNYIRLYRAFYDVWNYRSQMPRDVKLQIYPYGNPFDDILPRNIYQNELNIEQIKNACLTVFENMVYAGVDDEHRKLGTLHALSALTMVSIDARHALPWLYEAVVF